MPTAWGDPTAVEQIFANLLGNAVTYLDPARPGRIEVGTQSTTGGDGESDLRVYYVKDNGLGIPEAYHDRVFTAFNRLHPDAAQGEGIGLALVRRMVERHGGTIWLRVDARRGHDVLRRLARPAARTACTLLVDRQTARSTSSTGRLTRWLPEPILIVLVEDDDGHATLVERNLARVGVANTLLRLRDGQEAIDFFTAHGSAAADVAAVDPAPARHQDAACRRDRGACGSSRPTLRPRSIPVIVLTTTDDPREVQRCYELGCSVYITKPVDYQAFVEAIKRLGLFLQVVRIPDFGQTRP